MKTNALPNRAQLTPPAALVVSTPAHRPPVLTNLGELPNARAGNHTLIFEGHVYRIEQKKVAGLSSEEIAESLLELYLRRGPQGLTEVIGEMTLVVIGTQDVLAYRNLTSPFQIYYSSKRVSNHLSALLDRGTVRLNEEYLLNFLLRRERLLYQCHQTPFAGVLRLPAGHVLRLRNGKSPEVSYIEKVRKAVKVNYKQTESDVVPRISALMEEVVGDRIQRFRGRPLVCQLSGGLDSSYLASLIGGKTRGTKAFLYSYPVNPSHRFSETCATAVAETYGLDFSILPPETFLPFDLATGGAFTDEPSQFSWQGAVFGSKLATLVEDQSVIFCGSGSDQLFYRQPNILPWLLRQGEGRAFFATLGDCGRALKRSPASLLYQSVLSLIPARFYSPLIEPASRLPFNLINFEDINSDFGLLDVVPWIRPYQGLSASKLQRRALLEEQREHEQNFGNQAAIRSPLCALADPQMAFVPYLRQKHVDYQMPFSDSRLLDLVYEEISWHLIYDWKHPYKHLLREAQKGVVPEITRTRRKNEFHFTGFLNSVLDYNRRYLRDLLEEGEAELSALFDFEGVRGAFERLLFGFNDNSSRSVLGLISYLLWLRDFKRGMEIQWEKQGSVV